MEFLVQFLDIQISISKINDAMYVVESVNSDREIKCFNLDIPIFLKPITKELSDNTITYDFVKLKKFSPKFPNTKNVLLQLLDYSIVLITALKILHQDNLSIGLLSSERFYLNEEDELIVLGNSLLSDRYSFYNFNDYMLEDLLYLPPECYENNNIIADYRADFYALGVIMYRWFTGNLPFKGNDKLSLMHQHLTKAVDSPRKLNSKLSNGLSDLILTLLEKHPTKRYNSAFGILKDLEQIKKAYLKGDVSPIKLNIDFNPGQINFGDTLFGRDKLLEDLNNYYNQIDLTHSQVVFVEGFSGVGKTSLINGFLKTVHDKETIILKGKFDQYTQSPYSVIKMAFMDFQKQILLKSKIDSQTLKTTFTKRLGNNAGVLKEIIPSIELILDNVQDVDDLNPIETRNRFNFVFHKFCQTLLRLGLKIILFIDDWQWCDQPSLQLIKSLILQNTQGILFMFAYRGNEISQKHPFNLFKNEIDKTGYCHNVKVESLTLQLTNNMLASALEMNALNTKEISSLVYQKTDGNPFYIKQFILSLNQKRLLTFNGNESTWRWERGKIEKEGLSENVIDVISKNIDRLSYETQIIFKIASCSGKFNLDLISIISGINKELIAILLDVAVGGGYVTKEIEGDSFHYKFVHDRIQQASYQLNVPSFSLTNEQLHYKIGTVLLDGSTNNNHSEREILSHFLLAKNLVTKDISIKLIELIVAINNNKGISITPDASREYLGLGLYLNEKYKINTSTFQLYYGLSESCFLLNEMDTAEYFADKAIKQTERVIEKVEVLRMKMLFYESFAMFEKNIDTGLLALELFSINAKSHFKDQNLKPLIEAEYNLFNSLTHNDKYIDDLSKRAMSKPEELAVMDILVNMNASAYFVDLYLFAWSTLKMSNQTLQYGLTNSTPFAFVFMGSLLVAFYQDFERGYTFGKSGVDLLAHVESNQYKSRTLSIFPIFIQHFKEPIRNSITNLNESIYSGLETGDLPYAGYSFYAKVRDAFLSGDNLGETLKLCEESIDFMESVNNLGLLSLMKLLKGSLLKLTDSYNSDYKKIEREALQLLLEVKFLTAVSHHYIFRSWAHCILKEFKEAEALLKKNEEIIIYAASQPHVPKHYFLESLCLLYQNKNLSKSQEERIQSNQDILKAWSSSMPENFRAEYTLIETLLIARTGNIEKALISFNESLKWASSGQLLGTRAFAFELMSDILKTSDFLVLGDSFLQSALLSYQEWGATSKLNEGTWFKDSRLTSKVIAKKADLNTTSLIKAMQAISFEVDKNNAIKKLLNVLMENAGADRSILILIENGIPFIEAEIALGKDEHVINREQYDQYKALPKRIIDYVINTKKEFVLDDSTTIEQLNESYTKNVRIKSLLALPLVRQRDLIGVLYLENKQFEGLFKGNDLEILKIIASQAAISIYNTLLFKETTDLNIDLEASKEELSKMNLLLEDKIKDRTKILRQEIETRKQIEIELKKAQKEAEKYHQQQIKEERREALQSKMMMLSSQMNPHFIFNSLGSVQSYIFNNDTKRAVDFISEFAGLMRKNLINSTTKYISIAEEIEFFDKYLLLEKIRFDNSFNYKIKVDIDNIHDTLIPPMLLQPFIENAIIHGLSKLKNRKGRLTIELKENKERVICTILDNGIGRRNALKHRNSGHKSVAISNLETRIELLNSASEDNEYNYKIVDLYNNEEAIGTKVVVSFPNDLH